MEEMAGILTTYTWRIITALVIVLVGILLARVITRFIERILIRIDIPSTTRGFLVSFIYVVIIIIAIVMALTRFEIDIGPLIIGIGIVGFIAGLAIQGALSNAVAGIMILVQRPFQVGDIVEAGGETGEVKEITTTSTVIDTPQNVKVIIPNAKILADKIKNYSTHRIRRISIPVEIEAGVKVDSLLEHIKHIISTQEKVLKEPPSSATISSLSSSKIVITVKVWCSVDDIEEVSHNILYEIKKELESRGNPL